jgi:hypothetical protein
VQDRIERVSYGVVERIWICITSSNKSPPRSPP